MRFHQYLLLFFGLLLLGTAPVHAYNILYITGSENTDTTDFLTNDLGHAVTTEAETAYGGDITAADSYSAGVTIKQRLESFDLVLIGRGTGSNDFTGASNWASVQTGIIGMSPYALDDIGWFANSYNTVSYSGGHPTPDTTAAAPGSPLLSGVTLDANDQFDFLADVATSNGPATIPASNGIGDGLRVLEDVNGSGSFVVTWNTGDDMGGVTNLAAARVFFTSYNNNSWQEVTGLTADGKTVLTNAIDFAVIPEPGAGTLLQLGLFALLFIRRRPRA